MISYFHKYNCPIRSSEHKTKYLIPAILAGLMFLAGSCEDPPGLLGGKLLPGSDYVTISSSLLSVKSYTMYGDSIASSQPSVSYLGTIYDPYFGTTTCEFVSQLRLSSAWDEGPFSVDSVKLFLQLLTVKGDTADKHYLKMSEIADVIYNTDVIKDVMYYSSQTVPLTGYAIPDIELPALYADTVNYVSLNVGKAFGTHLFRNPEMLFHRSDAADFSTYFRGLHFQLISPDDPIFLSLSVKAPSSSYQNYFEVYGKDKDSTQRVMAFLLDALTTNASFNLYRHDHSTAEAGKKIEHINDLVYLDTMSYAQTFNGLYTKLVLTKLDSIKNAPDMQGIAVNKARLKIPVVYDNDIYRRSTIPYILYLRYLATTGKRHDIPEKGTAYFNGTADTSATLTADDVYTLNIATFVQDYLNDEADTIPSELELYLHPAIGNNLIIRANGSYKPIKFEFVYTKF